MAALKAWEAEVRLQKAAQEEALQALGEQRRALQQVLWPDELDDADADADGDQASRHEQERPQ